jgi:hypothetical protein
MAYHQEKLLPARPSPGRRGAGELLPQEPPEGLLENPLRGLQGVSCGLLIVAALAPGCVSGSPGPKDATSHPAGSEEPAEPPQHGIATPARAAGEPGQGTLVVQGIFDPTGERLLKLEPIRLYQYQSKTIPDQADGLYMLHIEYLDGSSTVVAFDALVADDSNPGRQQHGFFEVTVPLRGEVASVTITDKDGKRVYASVPGSEIRREP